MIATITAIAALALEKRSEIDLIVWKQHFSDRSNYSISQRSLKSGFHMIATIAERFFQRSQQS